MAAIEWCRCGMRLPCRFCDTHCPIEDVDEDIREAIMAHVIDGWSMSWNKAARIAQRIRDEGTP